MTSEQTASLGPAPTTFLDSFRIYLGECRWSPRRRTGRSAGDVLGHVCRAATGCPLRVTIRTVSWADQGGLGWAPIRSNASPSLPRGRQGTQLE